MEGLFVPSSSSSFFFLHEYYRQVMLTLFYSTMREIPDHQELFLSATTLSSLIFEINEYVPKQQVVSSLSSTPDLLLGSGGGGSIHADTDAEGIAAAIYHLRDLCDEDDTMDVISAPRKVQLQKKSLTAAAKGLSAFSGLAKFTTPRKQRRESAQQQQQRQQRQDVAFVSVDASGGGSSSSDNRSTQSCHFLLVRLPEKETDLLVFVNVPHDEFNLQGDPRALAKEEELASGLIEKFIEVLDVNDWGLLG